MTPDFGMGVVGRSLSESWTRGGRTILSYLHVVYKKREMKIRYKVVTSKEIEYFLHNEIKSSGIIPKFRYKSLNKSLKNCSNPYQRPLQISNKPENHGHRIINSLKT